MALILNIETSTNICSVALSENNKIVTLKETNIKNSHSELLSVFVEEIFKEEKINASKLSAVAVSKGPGSYTGLRIGVSLAKGLCYGSGLPMISVNTLEALAFGFAKTVSDKALFCPMLDARRMEVYCSIFDNNLNVMVPTKAEIVNENSFAGILENNKVYFFGNGACKCKNLITNKNAVFSEFDVSATFMANIAYKKYKSKDFEDVAYFNPFYLKDFVAIPSKNKVL